MSKRRHSGRVARPSSHAANARTVFSFNVLTAALFGLTAGAALVAAPAALAQEAVDGRARTSETATQAPAGESGAGVKTLPAVRVTGQSEEPAAPYAGGQVTYGGRAGFLGERDSMSTPFSVISYTDKYIRTCRPRTSPT